MAVRVPCEVRVGTGTNTSVVATESRHLLGPIEGSWWVKYSWWVIPLGFIILLLPWLILGGLHFSWGPSTQSSVSRPVIIRPVVVVQPAPSPAVSRPPAPSSGEPTAEDLDRRHSEYIRRRD